MTDTQVITVPIPTAFSLVDADAEAEAEADAAGRAWLRSARDEEALQPADPEPAAPAHCRYAMQYLD
ncbi:hypothetical protein [Kitasatospora sp. NBC_01302]|uniref:hypothetical protein n=1 Tax=Kitasatospora sp. NBC_01302 TaxID=2903575 RepID=UPI002E14F2FC|nr:hypothetical protein OG294_10540 [Kitasatospora sp. NBC_01302]